MPKFKDLLPNIFSSNNNTKNKEICPEGRLEKDACAVDDNDQNNDNRTDSSTLGYNNPATATTASTDLTESVVRELSHPNYDSATGTVMERVDGDVGEVGAIAATVPPNAMNVQNNQQQNIVMQISNANNLHFGSVFNFNNNLTTAASKSSGVPDDLGKGELKGSDGKRRTPKTRTIVTMMQSTEEPNHRMLDTIATHLGEGWKQVMRDLGHSEGQIDQAIIDHQMHGGIKEVIYRLLLQWIRGADDNQATLGYITALLWETNHRDCVERMKIVWKSEEKRKTSTCE